MSIFNALSAALYTKLTGTAALTSLLAGTASVYNKITPADAELDYVVFNIQAGGDDNMSAHRTKDIIVFVRGFSTKDAKAGSIDAQIDAALHMTALSISGWVNFWIARERDLEIVETGSNGENIFMRGGYYRVRAEKT